MSDLELAVLIIDDYLVGLQEEPSLSRYSPADVRRSVAALRSSIAEIPSLTPDTRTAVMNTLLESLRVHSKVSR
jgi:hypothetical protein